MAIIINEISIKNKLGKALQAKRFQGFAYQAAKTRTYAATVNMTNEFENHDIVKELKAGNEALSKFLPGRANLSSFIGFPENSNPTDDLRDFLVSKIKTLPTPAFRNNIQKNRVFYEFPVQYPTLQEIYDATPMPSEKINRSWVEIIQSGFGTFSHYVFSLFAFRDIDSNRSKTGIQIEHARKGVKDRVLGNIPFINKIMNNFKSRIRGETIND